MVSAASPSKVGLKGSSEEMTDHKPESHDIYWPEHLETAVDLLEYKPNWMTYLAVEFSEDGSGGLTFFVVSNTENSLDPGKRIRVRHGFLVPPASYDLKNWKAWLVDRLGDVEMHERNEFVKFGGVREFAPHHGNGEDPYRTWHIGTEEQANKSAGDD